ncbi:DUF6929 family protein [Lysobacter capsici]|uniref:DUF6929 family protein n=1 Tax=Lysobacter capsici TaxID=435897 RepID=UPI001C00377C|nr:hypothetical protein [Lysobacter capsici]QWF17073.1 hypothetical protein KME82_25655 [Lysobacter capsici]
MIELQPLRSLTLSTSQAAMPDRLSAASGIVVVGEVGYVVADDELHLGVFDLAGRHDGGWVRIFPGDLPDEAAARKALKPDLEALVRLPPFAGHPDGALLALASGSKPNRRTGVLLGLDASGALSGAPRPVDLSVPYAALQTRFPALNIEGAVVRGQELVLLQRASGGHPENALIGFALAQVLDALGAVDELRLPELPARFITVDLGQVDGVPLGFTDGSALADGRIVFSAVAEHVDDTYHDGPCVGAAVGIVDMEGRVQRLELVEPVQKIEGIDARVDATAIRFLLVTDGDDRGAAGALFGASLVF